MSDYRDIGYDNRNAADDYEHYYSINSSEQEDVRWQDVLPQDRTFDQQVESFVMLNGFIIAMGLDGEAGYGDDPDRNGFFYVNLDVDGHTKTIEYNNLDCVEDALDAWTKDIQLSDKCNLNNIIHNMGVTDTYNLYQAVRCGNELFSSPYFSGLENITKERFQAWTDFSKQVGRHWEANQIHSWNELPPLTRNQNERTEALLSLMDFLEVLDKNLPLQDRIIFSELADTTKSVEDMITPNRTTINIAIRKMNVIPLSKAELHRMIDAADKLFSSPYLDKDILDESSQHLLKLWTSYNDMGRTFIESDIMRLNETFADLSVYDEGDDVGFKAVPIDNGRYIGITMFGDPLLAPNGLPSEGVTDQTASQMSFKSANEAFTWLQNESHYTRFFRNAELSISPMADRMWQYVMPTLRTEDQQVDSFEQLNDFLIALQLGEAVWVPVGNGVEPGEQGSIVFNDNRFMVHNVEEFFSNPDILSETTSKINDAIMSLNNTSDRKTRDTIFSGENIFKSEYINLKWIPENVQNHWNDLSMNIIDDAPILMVKEYQKSAQDVIKKVSPLLDVIGLYAQITKNEDGIPSIALHEKSTGMIYDDRLYGNAQEIGYACEDEFKTQFLNGKNCCEYFKNFDSFDQARQTSAALGDIQMSNAIALYMDIMGIPQGKPMYIPFNVDEKTHVEYGKNDKGDMYVKNFLGHTQESKDSLENRKLFAWLYKQEIGRANNAADNIIKSCNHSGYRPDKQTVSDWLTDNPNKYYTALKKGLGYAGLAHSFMRDQRNLLNKTVDTPSSRIQR